MDHKPRVFVVDDDPDLRHSLRWLLESAGHTVDVFASAEDFLSRFRPGMPGCVLLDIRMPGMGGLSLLDLIHEYGASLPIIVFTGHGDVPIAVRSLKAGAFDFIEKPANRKQILDRVRDALSVDKDQRERNAEHALLMSQFSRLSSREREVLDKLVDGDTTKTIAVSLNLSEKTIEKYRASLMEKMGTRSLGKLIRMAIMFDHGQRQ